MRQEERSMLTIVLAVAVVGMALLAVAVLTDNTIVALLAIVVAVIGLVLLAREWLADRRQPADRQDDGSSETEVAHDAHGDDELEPDMFEPDVAYEDGEQGDVADS